jgi:hypothetical protein
MPDLLVFIINFWYGQELHRFAFEQDLGAWGQRYGGLGSREEVAAYHGWWWSSSRERESRKSGGREAEDRRKRGGGREERGERGESGGLVGDLKSGARLIFSLVERIKSVGMGELNVAVNGGDVGGQDALW